MGSVTAKTLIDRASYLLEDTSNVTWTRTELLGWVNEAQTQVVAYAPGANTSRVSLPLVAGTLQTLPSSTLVLIDVPRNVSGPAIRVTSREVLDNAPTDWHTATSDKFVRNYVYDANDQYSFYVSPPNNGAGAVVAVVAQVPTVVTSEGQTLDVDDSYSAAVVNYVAYRAYSKDTDYVAGGAEKAAAYYSAFKDAIANRGGLQAVVNANNALGPATVGNQGSTR